jgi:hypothetical protein
VVYEGATYHGLAYRYKGEVIWGATARIMLNLVDLVKRTVIQTAEKFPEAGDRSSV